MSADRIDRGTIVKLENLQNATHLNGYAGKVIGVLPNGRYEVELLQGAQRLSLKLANLQVISTSNGHAERTCLGCLNVFPTEQLHNCSRCRMAHYCSKACQTSHWREEHKDDCKLLRSARKAKDDEDKLPADKGDRVFARQQRGLRYQTQGNHAGAEKEFRAIIDEIEGAPWAANYLNLANALVSQGKTMEAAEMLRKAVECDGTFLPNEERLAKARAYGLLGDILMVGEGRNVPEAKEAFQKSLELDPSDAYRWRKLASLLESQGDAAGARNALQRADQEAASGPSVVGPSMEMMVQGDK